MKNNTKLIMETWRRFIKEGPDGIDEELPGEPPFEDQEPLEGDEDLESGPFDREVQGGGPNGEYIPDEGIINVIRQEIDSNPSITDEELMQIVPEAYPEDIEAARGFQDDDYYGDPAIQTGDAPMLRMSGDDGEDYETGDSEYESGSTFNGMPSEEFYDYSDDSEGDL